MTQRELGQIIGVSVQTVRNWEKKEPLFLPKHYEKLMNLGVNPFYISGAESMTLPGKKLERVQDNIKEYLHAENLCG